MLTLGLILTGLKVSLLLADRNRFRRRWRPRRCKRHWP